MEGKTFGRYRLVDLLGRGGMGEVWRAYDAATDREVALKVLPPNLANDPTFQERFRREAKAAAKLDEPHVVPIYDYGEIDGSLFVSMRLINGTDLQGLLARGPLEPARTVHIIEQIATALHAAHEVRLLHRDVKPSNILVAKNDFAYLIDFGIARGIDEKGMTQTGSMIGTLHYMAPERMSGGVVDGRSDVYALACVLHQCLTGSKPFPGDTLERQLVGHLSTPPPRPSQLRRGLPLGFDAVIAKGMAKDPDQRYSATTELAQGARWAVTSAPSISGPQPRPAAVSTPPPTPPRPVHVATPPPPVTPTPPRPMAFQQFASGARTPVPTPPPNVRPSGPTPEERLSNTTWKVLNSWWILPPLLSFGYLSWLGFLVAGIRTGMLRYWLPCVGYLGLVLFVLIAYNTEGYSLGVFGTGLLIFNWVGPAVHAAIANRWYLRDLAYRGSR